MIEFNPYFRYTADMWLSHPYFDGIRKTEMEAACESKIKIKVETKFSDSIISAIGDYVGK